MNDYARQRAQQKHRPLADSQHQGILGCDPRQAREQEDDAALENTAAGADGQAPPNPANGEKDEVVLERIGRFIDWPMSQKPRTGSDWAMKVSRRPPTWSAALQRRDEYQSRAVEPVFTGPPGKIEISSRGV